MPENPQPQTLPPQPPQQKQTPARASLGVPIAIVIAAALVAGAIVYTGSQKTTGTQVANGGTNDAGTTADVVVAPVTDKDHILGNPNAPIMIVEYSDFDCPFCKAFHATMHQVMDTYGADGKVAWVYRNMPLVQLHPNAKKLAEAAECVASIGGNTAYWKFADLIFGERGTNEQTDMTKLPVFAEQAGVSKAAFTECQTSGKFAQKIEDDIAAAIAAGANGTPHSILIAGDQQGPINGAQPYSVVKGMIDTLLAQTGG